MYVISSKELGEDSTWNGGWEGYPSRQRELCYHLSIPLSSNFLERRERFYAWNVCESMNTLFSLKLAVRQARRSPAFFAIAVAALALGIGANTAIFSAVEGVLLRPLPYAQPDRLVIVWEDAAFIGFAHNTPSAANYVDLRKQNQVVTDMAALRDRNAALTGDQAPEQVIGRGVTPNFFDVLGVQPTVGRQFTAEEDAAKRKVVVLSYALWQRRYGGDASLIGRSILMDGEPAGDGCGYHAARLFLSGPQDDVLGTRLVHGGGPKPRQTFSARCGAIEAGSGARTGKG